MNKDKFIPSRQFDVWRWSDYPELNNCLDKLIAEIESHEGRKRRRTGDEAKRFRVALRALVLDIYVAWKSDPEPQVAISLRSSDFNPGNRYHALFLKYKPLKAAFEGLRDLGYLTVDKTGVYGRTGGKSYRTKIRATRKLIDKLTGIPHFNLPHIKRNPEKETIVLKDDGEWIDYEETPETEAMRERLALINSVLSANLIDIYLPDEEFRELNEEIRDDPDKPAVDVSSRELHRVFNNGSFEEGGRFYGGWWQNIPRDYRRLVTINGKLTTELDFNSIHARILYAMEGAKFPDDPFNMVGFGEEHRPLVKKTFYALINAKGDIKQPPEFKEANLGISWKEFCDRIMEAHSPIKSYFKSGYGVKLMKMDSDIAEKVMLHFTKMGVPCLSIHDSFIVHQGYRNELDQVMRAAFWEVVKAEIDISAKESEIMRKDRDQTSDGLLQVEDRYPELDDLIREQNRYKSYHEREDAWRSSRYLR